jgi:hypothetical protein
MLAAISEWILNVAQAGLHSQEPFREAVQPSPP